MKHIYGFALAIRWHWLMVWSGKKIGLEPIEIEADWWAA